MPDLVLRALRAPQTLPQWPLPDWELLLRQARHAGLLPRLAERLAASGDLCAVHAAPRQHLQAALTVTAAQHDDVRREVEHVRRALAPLGVPLLLLKGAAYVAAGAAAARGRVFSDVDILVPRERLNEVEAALMMNGWVTTHHSAYDQRYYRRWMHELPPLMHIHRHTVLDVHHTILPLTARLTPDPALLLAAARPLPGATGVLVPCDEDLLLHSMTHLFFNEEQAHALRDLSDIDLLLRDFGRDPAFWPRLVARARQLGLARPLYEGLRYAAAVLGTPVPASTLQEVEAHGPPRAWRPLMDGLWQRAFATLHPGSRRRGTALALFMLYVRAHWLRMPPRLLLPHLLVKALGLHELRRPRQDAEAATPPR